VTTIRVVASTLLFASVGLAQAPPAATLGGLELQNAPLANVIDGLARQLGIDFVLDTRVAAGVAVTTHGDGRGTDLRGVLEVLLQGSRAKMVETTRGQLQIPVFQIMQQTPGSEGPAQTTLHLVFLQNMAADMVSQLVLRLAGQDPVEVVRNVSSNLLLIRISAPSIP
jgi:hypothetical protein